MKPRAGKGLLLLLAASLLVVSTGCPNSTVITAGVGTTQLAIVMTNPTRFDVGAFTIDRILIVPTDPNAAAAIGTTRDLTLLRTGVFVDTTEPMVDPSFLTPVRLADGEYEIIEIRLSQLFFVDTTFVSDPSTCEGAQQFYAPSGRVTITSFTTPQTFDVRDGQSTPLGLTFDLTQMMTALNNAHTCTMSGGNYQPVNPASFNRTQFAADTLDYLTID